MNAAADDETAAVAETNNGLVRAMMHSPIENKDIINDDDGVLPQKEEEEAEEEDEDEEENPNNCGGRLAAATATDGSGTRQEKEEESKSNKKQQQHQQQQPLRKRHGARNQHKMKHFVRWLLETFPEILVIQQQPLLPPPTSRTTQGNVDKNRRAISSTSDNTSNNYCNHDAEQKSVQKKEEEDANVIDPSRTETKSASYCSPNDVDDTMPTPPRFDDDDTDDDAKVPLILDVAGGKGELAARLCLCLHLRVVLVDPRGPANIAQTYTQTIVPRLPKKWQERLQQRLGTNPNHVHDILNANFHQVLDYFSYPNAVADSRQDDNHHQQQKESLHRMQQAVQDASLLIGMHADGATEDIIDVALHYRKPFVVVPCCVFANLFSHRQVRRDLVVPRAEEQPDQPPTDEPQQQQQERPPPLPEMTFAFVRTHDQFCQYLLDKDARFQKSILPFEGRNVAIWWNGK